MNEQTKAEYSQFHLRLPKTLLQRIKRAAEQDHRSVSATMRMAIEKFLYAREISKSDTKRLLEK